MSFVSFSYGTNELVANGVAKPVKVDRWFGLYSVGPSRGENLDVAHMDGTHPLGRERGELPVSLSWIVFGRQNFSGTAATNEHRQARINLRELGLWFDAAPGKYVTVVLDDDEHGEWEAGAHHIEWGEPEWHGSKIHVRQLLMLHEGLMAPASTST